MKLAKSKVGSQRQQKKEDETANTIPQPETRVQCWPVYSSADSLVSTPEKLKEFVDLPSVPRIVNTITAAGWRDNEETFKPKKVQICLVNWNQLMKIEARTDCDTTTCVWSRSSKKMAWKILSLREKEVPNTRHPKFPFWEEAGAALSSGWRELEPRYPFILYADSLILTPEKLKEIADLPSRPEVLTTTRACCAHVPKDSEDFCDDNCNWKGVDRSEKIQICDISRDQCRRVEERTEFVSVLNFNTYVWFKGQRRTIWKFVLKAEREENTEES